MARQVDLFWFLIYPLLQRCSTSQSCSERNASNLQSTVVFTVQCESREGFAAETQQLPPIFAGGRAGLLAWAEKGNRGLMNHTQFSEKVKRHIRELVE